MSTKETTADWPLRFYVAFLACCMIFLLFVGLDAFVNGGRCSWLQRDCPGMRHAVEWPNG